MSEIIQQTYLNKSRKDKFLFTLNLPNALKAKNSTTDRKDTKLNLDSLQFSVYGTVVPKIEKPAVEILKVATPPDVVADPVHTLALEKTPVDLKNNAP